MMTDTKNEQVEKILSEARKDIKGRYYVYEQYKSRLQAVCTSSMEYERAIFTLTRILKV